MSKFTIKIVGAGYVLKKHGRITSPMKLLNIDHIHFFATDLDEAIRFYEDVGFMLVQRFEHGGREAAQLRVRRDSRHQRDESRG